MFRRNYRRIPPRAWEFPIYPLAVKKKNPRGESTGCRETASVRRSPKQT